MTDTGYLEEAAAEFRKARDDNERRFATLPSLSAGNVPADAILAEVNERRMRIAEGFTALAAIKAGAVTSASMSYELPRAGAVMTGDGRQPVILDIDGPRDPLYVLEVAEAFAEASRVLNHLTLSHEALQYPAEADALVRDLASAASRLPQLFGQVGGWLEREDAAERIAVPSGEYQGNPLLAVATARSRLEMASAIAAALQEALDDAASVMCDLATAETGGDGSDG